MITGLMTFTLIVGALLAVAAVSAEWVLLSAKLPVRFVWLGAIVLTVGLTVAAPLRGINTRPVPAALLAVPASRDNASALPPTRLQSMLAMGHTVANAIVRPVQRTIAMAGNASVPVTQAATALWLLSTITALLVVMVVYVRSTRERLRWPHMLIEGQRVRVTPNTCPAVIGVAPSEIVIPHWVLLREKDEQRLVLLHEGEHVRAGDPLLLVCACLAVALMPWNAALWYMWSRLRLAVELDCDRRVLQHGARKTAYGELLVELSHHRPWLSAATPAFSWGTSHLEQRLVAMTATPARFRLLRRTAGAGVVSLALLGACQSELPTGAQIDAMDATTATLRTTRAGDSTVYFVNGRSVSKSDANAIVSGDISSIEIVRTGAPRPVSEVRITLASDTTKTVNGKRLAAMRDSSSRTVTNGDSLPRSSAARGGTLMIHGDSSSRILYGSPRPCRVDLRNDPGADCSPLFIVDGVVVDAASFKALDPDRILSVDVIKGAAAERLYGAKGVNGVINIKLK